MRRDDQEAKVAQALQVLCDAAETAASRWRQPFTVIVLRHGEDCVRVPGMSMCVDTALNALYDEVFTAVPRAEKRQSDA